MSQTLHCCKQLRLLLIKDEYQRLSYSSCRRRMPCELLVCVALTDARYHCRSCEFQQIHDLQAKTLNSSTKTLKKFNSRLVAPTLFGMNASAKRGRILSGELPLNAGVRAALPGRPGQLPTQGSHRSGRAHFEHPARRTPVERTHLRKFASACEARRTDRPKF
jgi:hypothetical protein